MSVLSYRVTLSPSTHQFSVDDQTLLLQGALDAGFAPAYGCRNGACGSCKATVLEGSVDHGKAQESALTQDERAQGKVLLCCATARSDLHISCREVDAASDIPLRILPVRVEQIARVAADVIVLSLKLPAGERLQFLAGQYVEFLLKDGKRRAFSIANAPHDDALLTLHIRHIPGGLFTERLFTTLKERDILRLQAPLGSFFLREESAKPMILLAGGTGFAPIKALIEHALHSGCTRPMHLYWGARDQAGLYLPDLPIRWAREQPLLHYVPVLSDVAWEGRSGLVHRAVLQDHPDLSGFQVYACGAPAMIDAARADFCAAGLPDGEFFADSFSYAPT